MVDTIRGHSPELTCTDCVEKGKVVFVHWGLLVPEGKTGYFCGPCWEIRTKYYEDNKSPKPFPRKSGRMKAIGEKGIVREDGGILRI